MNRKCALFLQCTDAAFYPPILNASALMADDGWAVTVLSSPSGEPSRIETGVHPGVRHLSTPARRGNAVRGVEFAGYVVAAVAAALRQRPRLIYASDYLSALPALAAQAVSGAAIVYHEHDSPDLAALRPIWARWRRQVARGARLVIAPNAQRGRLMAQTIGFDADRLRIVWNMPRREDLPVIAPRRAALATEPLVLYCHGSIGPDRLPLAFAEALRRLGGRVRLRIAGYEAPSGVGHIARLIAAAGDGGDGLPLIDYLGEIPQRADLLKAAAEADVGLALMPRSSADLNMRHMTGASNKAFDYMAAGLALLVSDLDDWTAMFVTPGYGRACAPSDPASVVEALEWCLAHRPEVRTMAGLARARIEHDWNFDTAFSPILRALS